MILGIFCLRYAMGVAIGMGLEIARSALAKAGASLALGALTGFFAARALLFWRMYMNRRRS
jgi:hypothetical protein